MADKQPPKHSKTGQPPKKVGGTRTTSDPAPEPKHADRPPLPKPERKREG